VLAFYISDVEKGYVQIICVLFMNIGMSIYTGYLQPMQIMHMNTLLIGNEFFIQAVTLHMMTATPWVPDLRV
jgi:hypothetical protein